MFPQQQQVQFSCTTLAGTNKRGVLPKDEHGYRIQPIGALNCFNSAGDYYPLARARELFERSTSFMRRVTTGCLKAEEGHPKRLPGMSDDEFIRRVLTIDERNVCAHIADVWLDFDNVKGADGKPVVAIMGKIKPSGPFAAALDASYDNPHEDVCFSIRSFTDDKYVAGCKQRTLVEIVTFDRVTEPGIAHARKYRSPGLESMVEASVSVESLKKAVKPMPGLGMESNLISPTALFTMLGMEAPGFMRW